jgi:quinol-cytochrome oxidoreductase complex cytochrome b subunit
MIRIYRYSYRKIFGSLIFFCLELFFCILSPNFRGTFNPRTSKVSKLYKHNFICPSVWNFLLYIVSKVQRSTKYICLWGMYGTLKRRTSKCIQIVKNIFCAFLFGTFLCTFPPNFKGLRGILAEVTLKPWTSKCKQIFVAFCLELSYVHFHQISEVYEVY